MASRYFCLLTILLWGATPASADFYRYIDAKGYPVFTNDLNTVPEDRRDQVQTFKSQPTDDQALPRVSPELQRMVESLEKQEASTSVDKAPEKSSEKQLEEKKRAHQNLIEERESLLEQKRLLDIRYNTRKRKPVTRAERQQVEQRIEVVDDLINNFKW